MRHIWQEFYVKVDAIIFVVDSADYERMQEAKRELVVLLEEPSLAGVPFLVLGNKSDLRMALKPDQLANALGLSPSVLDGDGSSGGNEHSHPLRLFSCSLVEGHGYTTAFEVSIPPQYAHNELTTNERTTNTRHTTHNKPTPNHITILTDFILVAGKCFINVVGI